MKRLSLTILITMFITLTRSAYSQQIELETYIPPPVGVFDQLRVLPQPTLGVDAPCSDRGSFMFDQNMFDLLFCQEDSLNPGSIIWQSTTPVWVESSDQIYLKNLSGFSHIEDVRWVIGADNPSISQQNSTLTLRTNSNDKTSARGGLLAVGTLGVGTILPDAATLNLAGSGLGVDSRFIWYPRKAAFRSGAIDGTQWDDANTGDYSVAFGENTRADGESAFAAGFGSTAGGTHSVAIGSNAVVSDDDSFAFGEDTSINGPGAERSFAFGFNTRVDGQDSFAFGHSIQVDGNSSIGIGLDTTLDTVTTNNVMVVMGANVGVGASVPAADLHVYSDAASLDPAELLIGGSDDVVASIQFRANNTIPAGDYFELATGGSGVADPTSSQLRFNYFDASVPSLDTIMTLTNDGNVGIGTTAPSTKLHLANEGSLQLESTGGGTIQMEDTDGPDFRIRNTNGIFNIQSRFGVSTFGSRFGFSSNGGLKAGQGGNPSAELHAAQFTGDAEIILATTPGNTTDPMITFNDTDFVPIFYMEHDTNNTLLVHSTGSPAPSGILAAKPTGHVGIGTTDIGTTGTYPTHELYVNGTITASLGIACGSSKDLKENIEPLSAGEALLAFNDLNPVEFIYKADKDKKLQMGFIAEDMPELLATPTRKSINAMDITGVLTKMVQEQQKVLEEQQRQIDTLKKKLKGM